MITGHHQSSLAVSQPQDIAEFMHDNTAQVAHPDAIEMDAHTLEIPGAGGVMFGCSSRTPTSYECPLSCAIVTTGNGDRLNRTTDAILCRRKSRYVRSG